MVAQREEGEGGFPHWQFCVTIPRTRFATVRGHILGHVKATGLPIWLRGLMDRTTVEKTCLAKCRNYCKMDAAKKGGVVYVESRILVGLDAPPKQQGKRNDLVAYRKLLQEKKGIVDIMDEEVFGESELKTFARYPHMHSHMVSRVLAGTERPKPVCFAFTGPTGTGKTHRAWELVAKLGLKQSEVYLKDPVTQWWCGYDPSIHRAVIIDEYRGDQKEMWLTLTNPRGPPYMTQKKGSSVPVISKYYIFTSALHPASWIQSWNHEDHGEQWVRRLGARHRVCDVQHADAVAVEPEDAVFAALD